jgi:uncharacterized protein YxeA
MKKALGILVVIIIVLIIILAIVLNIKYDSNINVNSPASVYINNKENGSIDVQVLISVDMIEYEHLGKDLIYEYEYNGEPIKSGEIITLTNDTAVFKTTITEVDSIPDVGSSKITFNTNQAAGGQSKTTNVTVKEVGGKRYAGAYAVFEVTYELKPCS